MNTELRVIVLGEKSLLDIVLGREQLHRAEELVDEIRGVDHHVRMAHMFVASYLDNDKDAKHVGKDYILLALNVICGLTPGLAQLIQERHLLDTVILGAFRANTGSGTYVTSLMGMCNTSRDETGFDIAFRCLINRVDKIDLSDYDPTSSFHDLCAKAVKHKATYHSTIH